MTHTPGPWAIDPLTERSAAPEIVGNGRRIARVLYWMGSEDNEVKPNARLIAAAPEMLAALKMVKSEYERAYSYGKLFMNGELYYDSAELLKESQVYQDIVSAIAKAEGE